MRIRRRFGWAWESLANVDMADYHHIGLIPALSRSYNNASPREVSWRHARGKSQRPNHVHSEVAYESRNANWEKTTREYADELRLQARIKHEYVPLATGYCGACGEREYARISETSYGVTVWRRVHFNPIMLPFNEIEIEEVVEDEKVTEYLNGKEVCSGSGWSPPDALRGERVFCYVCGRKTAVISGGFLRRHFMQ